MIVPGNIRERPRGLDRAEIIRRVFDNSMSLYSETIELETVTLDLRSNSRLEEGAAFEILDRLAIARAQIDIITRVIKNATGHEIHDSY